MTVRVKQTQTLCRRCSPSFGVTSGNDQDILNAAQSNNAPELGEQSAAAQIIEGFVPGASFIGALVQYQLNKQFLDWKKQQTQKQGRGTFYIDQQEAKNQEQLMCAEVQSIFDLATSIISPPEGLVAAVPTGSPTHRVWRRTTSRPTAPTRAIRSPIPTPL